MAVQPVKSVSPRARNARWQVLALFVVTSVVISTLAVELIARFVFRKLADDRSYFEIIDRRILNSFPTLDPKADAKFGAVLTPNSEHTYRTPEFDFTVRTNSQGFRTREVEPRQPGEWRVMLVGDSYFMGYVKPEDGIDRQLERFAALSGKLARPLKVYNYAIIGHTTVQELIVAKTFAPTVKPDQIIVGFLAANDAIPNAVTYVDENDHLAISQPAIRRVQADIRSRIGWLRHSMIFRALSVSPYTTRLYYQIAREPYILEKNYAVLEQLKGYCARNQIALTVVMLHCKDGVHGGLQGAWTQSRTVIRSLVTYCRAHGIDTIDMVDFMHGAQAVNDLFYRVDGHPNAAGCRQIARTIFEKAVVDRLCAEDERSPGGVATAGESSG